MGQKWQAWLGSKTKFPGNYFYIIHFFLFITRQTYSFCNFCQQSYLKFYSSQKIWVIFPPNSVQSYGIKFQAIPLFAQRMTNILRLYHLFSVLDTIRAIEFKEDYNQHDSYIVPELIAQLQMQPWSAESKLNQATQKFKPKIQVYLGTQVTFPLPIKLIKLSRKDYQCPQNTVIPEKEHTIRLIIEDASFPLLLDITGMDNHGNRQFSSSHCPPASH